MHWAAHGHTAAEIVHRRADASRPHMGLTSWAGDRLRKTDVSISKNYLNSDEIDGLNRIVTAYLEFAELQALNRQPVDLHFEQSFDELKKIEKQQTSLPKKKTKKKPTKKTPKPPRSGEDS
jgi:hypothetical protein